MSLNYFYKVKCKLLNRLVTHKECEDCNNFNMFSLPGIMSYENYKKCWEECRNENLPLKFIEDLKQELQDEKN